MNLSYTSYQKDKSKAPKNAVILLHGYGANGADLLDLAPLFAGELPDTLFIAPDAPAPCEMASIGRPGFQWFSLATYTPDAMFAGAKEVYPVLQKFIAHISNEYDLEEGRIALLGFSQGTMMSLFAAVRQPKTFAGILGYSGAFLGDVEGDIEDLPILLIHGESDPIVPVEASQKAYDILHKNGADVILHSVPNLQHSIDQFGLENGLKFLKNCFK